MPKDKYIIYDVSGTILRSGLCGVGGIEKKKAGLSQGEYIMKGTADDITQKVVGGKIINKTPEEIDRPSAPEPVPYEQQQANITNEQMQKIIDRLEVLESK